MASCSTLSSPTARHLPLLLIHHPDAERNRRTERKRGRFFVPRLIAPSPPLDRNRIKDPTYIGSKIERWKKDPYLFEARKASLFTGRDSVAISRFQSADRIKQREGRAGWNILHANTREASSYLPLPTHRL